MENWLISSLPVVLRTAVSALLIFGIMLVLVRLGGLRTFAKMSSIDFASTIAIGSILASVALSGTTSVLQGTVALVTIIAVQQVFARLKIASDAFEDIVENQPLLLMDGATILTDNLRRSGVTHADLMAKLREANVLRFSEVKAVVLETTGDISVLHGSGDTAVEPEILNSVKR